MSATTTEPTIATPPVDIAPDPFLAAFDRLSELADDAPETAVTAAAEGQDTVAPAPAEGQDTVAPAPEAETSEAPDEGQDTVAPPADDADEDDDLLRRLSALVKKAPAEDAQPAPAAAADEPAAVYTAEEQKFLDDYKKDWPDVAKAEALARRAEYRQLVNFVFQEVAGYLKPIVEQVDVVATRTHLSDLQSKVTDYDDVRDKVIAWVGAQPNYLQRAYEHVIKAGTADEVADLVNRWRADAGVPATKPTPTASRPRETALPPAAKQAAAALAPVGSKRSAPSAGIDPGDFQGAFEAFAAEKA